MRFAGNRIEDFFGGGPDMGKIVAGGEQLRANERAANIAAQTQVKSASIYGDATKKSGQIIGDAQAAAGRDAMWGSIFSTVGQVAGAGIGAMGNSYGGTGSTGGAGDTVKIGDTGKYGTFQDPRITFNKMGYTIDPKGSGMFSIPRP